jgi:hypothetical protein
MYPPVMPDLIRHPCERLPAARRSWCGRAHGSRIKSGMMQQQRKFLRAKHIVDCRAAHAPIKAA